MKTKLIIALAALVAIGSTFSADQPSITLELRSGGHTNDVSDKIQATLHWQVVTNWIDGNYSERTLMHWTGGIDPNTTTFYEHGSVCSNLVAVVDWKGQKKAVLLESIQFQVTRRSYTIKTTTERIYR